jgi:NAD+ synthase (glutamine-hydrolysing)
MKIAIAQQNYHIGNFDHNTQQMLAAIEQAKQNQADVIVFSELSVCGYPPRDFLEFRDFIRRCQEVVDTLCAHSHGIGIIVGSPTPNSVAEGKDLYNSAYFLADGAVLHVQHKTLLPTYDIFDEYRYFEPNTTFDTCVYKGVRFALTVCEDIWNVGNENPLYTICPMDELIKQQPDVMINLSASPFSYDHAADRIKVLRANVERYKIPAFYVNYIGASTEIIFDGGSLVMNDSGTLIDELPYFTETISYYTLANLKNTQKTTPDNEQPKEKIALIYNALVVGIQNYFNKLGFKQAILGLSGGIDSAVVAVLAADALGASNVRLVLMPSQFSTDHSVDDALLLANNLGSPHDIIPIKNIYDSFTNTLAPQFEGTTFNITEENLQARTRGVLLMALSNKFGYILLNTSNKSEVAVGYGTLYGDMCGGLSVIGDVYKTDIFALARYINRQKEVIPNNILVKPPSAELRPNQKDSDSLPDYDLLDQVLFQYVEQRKGPQELVEMGFPKPLVDRTLRMVNINEYKRFQTPPILRVSSKAFGMGRRMPIEGRYLG